LGPTPITMGPGLLRLMGLSAIDVLYPFSG
jgi:hypothetical protein